MIFDRQGNLWFSESGVHQLGEFNPENGSFTEYPLGGDTASEIVSSPVGLAVDRDGEVWVADHGGNWIEVSSPQSSNATSLLELVTVGVTGVIVSMVILQLRRRSSRRGSGAIASYSNKDSSSP